MELTVDASSPRTLDQILSDLGPSYDSTINSYKSQQDALAPYQAAQMQGLSLAKDNAFGDILDSARERGAGFSGIPLQNQGKYIGSTYIPAVAGLEHDINNQRGSLTDAINAALLDKTKTANSLYTTEKSSYQDYLAKLAAAKAAAAANSFGGFGGNTGTTTTGAATGAPSMVKKSDNSGYQFFDANKNPISAAVFYAQTYGNKGPGFNAFLKELASSGDKGAGQAAGFIGNDFKYDPSKLSSQALADLYNSLIWGAPNLQQASYKAPAKPNLVQNIQTYAPTQSLGQSAFNVGNSLLRSFL